ASSARRAGPQLRMTFDRRHQPPRAMRLVARLFQHPLAGERPAVEVQIEAAALVAALDQLVGADIFYGYALAPLLRHLPSVIGRIDREIAGGHGDELLPTLPVRPQDPALESAAHVQPQLGAHLSFGDNEQSPAALTPRFGKAAAFPPAARCPPPACEGLIHDRPLLLQLPHGREY